MDIEVISCEIRACKKKIACLLIRYCELIMKCDLVYHPKYEKAWVRMPEVWITPQKKIHYCYWPTKEKSEEFQKEVLKKIFDKYSLDLEKVRGLHEEAILKRSQPKKCRQD